jgi:hypothetical protein
MCLYFNYFIIQIHLKCERMSIELYCLYREIFKINPFFIMLELLSRRELIISVVLIFLFIAVEISHICLQ